MIEVRAATATDVPGVIALVADVLAALGLEPGKGSPSDAELYDPPAS